MVHTHTYTTTYTNTPINSLTHVNIETHMQNPLRCKKPSENLKNLTSKCRRVHVAV